MKKLLILVILAPMPVCGDNGYCCQYVKNLSGPGHKTDECNEVCGGRKKVVKAEIQHNIPGNPSQDNLYCECNHPLYGCSGLPRCK